MTSPTLIFDHATQELTYHTVKDYLQSSPLFQCSLQIEPYRPQFHVIYGSASNIWFSHSILGGEHMDLTELQSCILAVVTIADHYDDALVEGYGGKRAIDA